MSSIEGEAGSAEGPNVSAPFSARLALAILLGWLFACAVMLWRAKSAILTGDFGGADDKMRLVQVRDFLAGQGWYDVTQYRMNLPEGAPMHWSRLVDLPLAAFIKLLTPLLGPAQAEVAAGILVPLLTLLCVMIFLVIAIRRLAGPRFAVFTALLVPIGVDLSFQLQPLRIDHHGWQIAAAAAALAGLVDRNRRRSGIVSGTAAAFWMQISIEGLPYAFAIGAIMALRVIADARESRRLASYLATLAIVSLALFGVFQGAVMPSVFYCDAVTPAHLAAFGIAAAISLVLLHPAAGALHTRLGLLAIAGLGAAGAFAGAAPQCVGSPFSKLDPIVRDFWYMSVKEGLPLWMQGGPTMASAIALFALGLAGYAAGHYRAENGGERAAWISAGLLLLTSILVAVFVRRAGAVAALYALPGTAVLLEIGLMRARRAVNLPRRVLLSAAVLIALLPVTPLLLAASIEGMAGNEAAEEKGDSLNCGAKVTVDGLNALPPSNMLTNLDFAPSILMNTPHSVVASGHHRNDQAMRDVILAFSGPVDQARRILERRNIDYIALCGQMAETTKYRERNPNGLFARLDRNVAPSWLKRVDVEDEAGALKVWRVDF